MTLFDQILKELPEHLKSCGISGLLRANCTELWEQTSNLLPNQLTGCSTSMIDYQHAYLRSAGKKVLDLSLILTNDKAPCALWPLTVTIGEKIKISSLGREIQAPHFITGLSPRTEKKITTGAISYIQLLQKQLCVKEIFLEEFKLPPQLVFGLSEWHQQWMSAGARAQLKHDLYVDLSLDFDQIKSNFRKSYRPLIEKGSHLWDVACFDDKNISLSEWQEFKELHKTVAGRVTRNDETWQLQFQMILEGTAFLISLRDKPDNRLIGGAFFQYTRDEGIYSIAAYDRTLFDKPVGHLVQVKAIEAMKARGLKWYKIGERFFPADVPEPTKKELSISSFKQGFTTHLLPKIILCMSS